MNIDEPVMKELVTRLSNTFNNAARAELKALEAQGLTAHQYRMGVALAHCAALGTILAWSMPEGRERMLDWLRDDGMLIIERFMQLRAEKVDELLAEAEGGA